MKEEEKLKARRLRSEQGLSIGDIAKELRVARSSVSVWVRDIVLTDKQKEILRSQNPLYNRQINGSITMANKHAQLRRKYREEGAIRAKENNILHAMGCMLYWGEGSKSTCSVSISNSDSKLLRLFKKFLCTCYAVKEEQFVVHIHCYTSNQKEINVIENYWLSQLDLRIENLRKTVLNCVSKYSKRRRGNTLEFGTCHLSVHDVKIKQSIVGAIQEYGDFFNSAWH
jgi:transposase-like protein